MVLFFKMKVFPKVAKGLLNENLLHDAGGFLDYSLHHPAKRVDDVNYFKICLWLLRFASSIKINNNEKNYQLVFTTTRNRAILHPHHSSYGRRCIPLGRYSEICVC